MRSATLQKDRDAPRRKKAEPQYDPVFFRKRDLEVGTVLLYTGRIGTNTFWRITRILSDEGRGRGMRSVRTVQKLSDILTLCDSTGAVRQMSFGYASYSAIWRLPQADPPPPKSIRLVE